MSWDHYKACALHSAAFTSYDEADATIKDYLLHFVQQTVVLLVGTLIILYHIKGGLVH